MGRKLFLWLELDGFDEEELEKLLTETLESEKKSFWLGPSGRRWDTRVQPLYR